MTDFMTTETRMPGFLLFPRFLLEADLSETAKLTYLVLLDRARCSQENQGWTDEKGRVFVLYPIEELGAALHKGERTIRRYLDELEQADLIHRRHQGVGKADRIFVKLPGGQTCQTGGQNCPAKADKMSRSGWSGSAGPGGQERPGNYTDRTIRTEPERESHIAPAGYGAYGNVFLSDSEYADLRHTVSDCDGYIERLSGYLASTGKRYQNHHATIRSWAIRDHCLLPQRDYTYSEEESL